jgi:hypothetical protein
VLFVGRVFCGVATSLLYSAFESWLVAEHNKRGFSGDWLGNTFSQAVFLGNGLVAIVSGLFAHLLVETASLGPVAPFDAASVTLAVSRGGRGGGGSCCICSVPAGLLWPSAPKPTVQPTGLTQGATYSTHAHITPTRPPPCPPAHLPPARAQVGGFIIFSTWSENFGDASEGGSSADGFKRAAQAIMSDPKIALLGAMQSLFEGSMYTFVFLWTPALSPAGEHIPHGMVFALFMVSSMVGSAVAGRLLANNSK